MKKKSNYQNLFRNIFGQFNFGKKLYIVLNASSCHPFWVGFALFGCLCYNNGIPSGLKLHIGNKMSIGHNRNCFSAPNPTIGGGFILSGDRWSYGAEVLFNINDRAQDYYGIVEYWINFSYRF
ncbi:MAG: hypothetical protein KDC49_12535 [Saprospiraceae bacterium]|nr:hypothetical protein [Saprospiraceae bacterium]